MEAVVNFAIVTKNFWGGGGIDGEKFYFSGSSHTFKYVYILCNYICG